MNGKSLKKRLMRGKVKSFWGERAYLTVRLPMNLFPKPFPHFKGKHLASCWTEVKDGKLYQYYISNVSSGFDPRKRKEGECSKNFSLDIFFLEENDSNQEWKSYSWWEGARLVFDSPDAKGKVIETTNLDKELISAYRSQTLWVVDYLQFGKFDECPQVLQEFLNASNWAKTFYHSFSKDYKYLYLTYSVKWKVPSYKRRFLNDLAKAMKVAKRSNLYIKVMSERFRENSTQDP